MRDYVVSYAIDNEYQKYFKTNLYGVYRKHMVEFASKGGREVAEGPPRLVSDYHYGLVEVWPLVYVGGDS